MNMITIHYGELSLKGKNKPDFERRLVENIKKQLEGNRYEKIERTEGRIHIYLNQESNENEIINKLKKVFGISWFSVSHSLEKDMEKLTQFVVEEAKKRFKDKKIKVETKRSDKKFEKTSLEISQHLWNKLREEGCNVDIKKPEEIIFIEVLKDQIVVSFGKIKGLGGLPFGSSGKLISLLSGGIDSPVASWLMMRRGCDIEFLHIHNLTANEKAKRSKIPKLIEKLKEFSGSKMILYLVPYHHFEEATLEVPSKIHLVLFRRFIAKIANRLCIIKRAFGVVTGDNIAQVASQTIENLYATDEAFGVPVYRPLAGHDKQEIVDLAKNIGTYELSIEEYKDCCSLVAAKHPSTKTRLDEMKKVEEEIEIEKVVEKTLQDITIVDV